MLCYHCEKASDCPTFRTLCFVSEDFCINKCKDFEDSLRYTYMKIAENHDLMRLIYDYFTDILEGYSKEEAEETIIRALRELSY